MSVHKTHLRPMVRGKFPVEDAEALAQNLNRVLTDTALCAKLKANARRLVQEYSFKKSCNLLEDCIVTNFQKTEPGK